MVSGFAKHGDQIIVKELERCIRRNFSGLDDLDPLRIFSQQFQDLKEYVKVKMLYYHSMLQRSAFR